MTGRVVPYPKFGAGVGLRRTSGLCARLGIDPSAWAGRACVITGSNGKGSTAAMTQAILSAHDFRTALFTSPHLHRFTERYRLDGDDIAEEALDRHWHRARSAVDSHLADSPHDFVGGFEFIFLIALCWIEEVRPDILVFEAGIGGRFDPTRLLAARLTALVSLDLEHTDLLGEDLASIACDKIDACAAGGEVLAGPVPNELKHLIVKYAASADRRVTFPSADDLKALSPLAGPVQAGNAALAYGLAKRLAGTGFDPAVAARGLTLTRWPGRLEVIHDAPFAVIDVGHSPAAVAAALVGLNETWGEGRFGVLVCGASINKENAAMVGLLAPHFSRIVCTAAAHKGRDPAEIGAMAQAANPDASVLVAETMTKAWAMARSQAAQGQGIYIAGGLFLAIEMRAVVTGDSLIDPFF